MRCPQYGFESRDRARGAHRVYGCIGTETAAAITQRDRHTRSAPSPLLGEANPSPQGGGEPTECVASPDQNSGSDFSRSDSGNDARGSTPSCPGLAQRDPGPRGHAMNLARATLRESFSVECTGSRLAWTSARAATAVCSLPRAPGLARFRHINLINPGGPGLIWVGEHTECAASHCWVTIKHPQGLAAGFKVPSEELLPAGPMEHRGVRYEIKVGIERNHFVWIIYTSPRSRQGSIRGTRQAAVSAAERAISAWWRRQHGHQAARVQRD